VPEGQGSAEDNDPQACSAVKYSPGICLAEDSGGRKNKNAAKNKSNRCCMQVFHIIENKLRIAKLKHQHPKPFSLLILTNKE
jgi:hypothetical protein